jgi:hypothetical protein
MPRLTRHGTFHVPLPPDRALALFTPRGEREWAPGWDPDFPAGPSDDTAPGTAFITHHGDAPTYWVVTDRTERSVRYARVTPGVHAGTVEVRCDPHGDATRAQVTYDLTALGSDHALARFGEHYDAMLGEWERLIAAALAARAA